MELQEKMKKEKDERERKENLEEERRQRAKLEAEQKRQAELEKQRQQQLEMEREQEALRKKMIQQRLVRNCNIYLTFSVFKFYPDQGVSQENIHMYSVGVSLEQRLVSRKFFFFFFFFFFSA